ncbi:MAG: FAD-dependent oxidoreductase [Desulfobacter postgatei]|uniref:FAD-dependent oxidoreductase n=1 Tax=Desulfobacter postgatei TaxID=2293 RepID=UPI0023F175C8|nr:FAD-dependent oxidoreductase [Desulfobacter postgatei]MDD4274189.1 FAD-dependent oxidoreductase [Desulfobacter postgatei]
MAKKIIIIGAVALGPKVASRLRRLDPDCEITMIDRDSLISYGGCGIPYYIGGDIGEIEELYSTTAHHVRDPEFFRTVKGVEVLTRIEAIGIDRRKKQLKVRHLDDGTESEMAYDKLVIGTGGTPFTPPIPGADLPGVYPVSNLHHAQAIKELISKGAVGNAVVIGAGAIGVEMAEALTDLWGVETTLVEMAPHVLPVAIGPNIALIVEKELEKSGVNVKIGAQVTKILGDAESGVTGVEVSGEVIECDLVIMAVGVRPNTGFAAEAGLAVGRGGSLIVDKNLRTTDPDIYAGGDCIEVRNLVSGEQLPMALGSLANRQGRIIATNIFGKNAQFDGTVGTFCIKVFGMGVATAGLTIHQAKAAGFDPVHSLVAQFDRAHFYPNSKFLFVQLIADRATRRVLGVEAVGEQIDSVKARVDAVVPLLHKGMNVDEVCTLEVGYAPPFSSAMDVINNAGNTLDNILDGRNTPMDWPEFSDLFEKGQITVVDLREAVEAQPFIDQYGAERWIHIPQPELRERYNELPKNKDLCLFCGTGARSFECQIILNQNGFTRVKNLQGGYAIIRVTDPDFIPQGG